MTEVKAAISVNDHFYQDCAIQVWVAEGAGYPVQKVTLACINSRFVYPGGGDYNGLLRCLDATEEVARRKEAVGRLIDELRTMLSLGEPQIAVGEHCFRPCTCPFIGHCGGARSTATPRPNCRFTRPTTFIAPAAERYPRHFLRFQAISSPVPMWVGTRPYQPIPVQWTCNTEIHPDLVVHREFVDLFDESSKTNFVHALIAALRSDGPVVVGSTCERACLDALCESVPEWRVELKAIIGRLVQVTPLARAAGQASNAPIFGEVVDEESAQRAWWEAASPATNSERRGRLADDLVRYSRYETSLLHAAYRKRDAQRRSQID